VRGRNFWLSVVVCSVGLCTIFAPRAEAAPSGFSVARFEPTPAGEWSFGVDHPWYARTRDAFAAGLTLDYAHDPLVFGLRSGTTFTEQQAVIEHQLVGHVDLAGSFLDRVTLSASLPVVLYEGGTAADGVAPNSGAAVGDMRFGVMVRIFGQPLASAFSLHAGADIWAPIGAGSDHAGDPGVRFALPKLVAAGFSHRVLWSATATFLYRPEASIGSEPAGKGNSVGPEVQLGGAIGYMDQRRRFSVGPEAILATVVTGGHGFHKDFTSLEMLLGAQYNAIRRIQLGLALGLGMLREPGTPDFRMLFRVAYAPFRGPKPATAPPPPASAGDHIVLPPSDRDHDGVADDADLCPDDPRGDTPDPARAGCPLRDRDGDGVVDGLDECPDEAAGAHPDPKRHGCPDKDSDGDGVFDSADQCVDVPAGRNPDAARPGCPLPDRDGDLIPDASDACPDKPGAPDPDPKKNGCPGLVELHRGQIVISQQIFFETASDRILPKSFPILQAVANVLVAMPELKISIEGHTDNRGKPAYNLDLSDRRSKSVRAWLIEHGIAAERLTARGFGQEKPIADNRTARGRATNRRVEFRIVESTEENK